MEFCIKIPNRTYSIHLSSICRKRFYLPPHKLCAYNILPEPSVHIIFNARLSIVAIQIAQVGKYCIVYYRLHHLADCIEQDNPNNFTKKFFFLSGFVMNLPTGTYYIADLSREWKVMHANCTW